MVKASAQGAGLVPWQFDLTQVEEDLFHQLVAPIKPLRRLLSLACVRVLAVCFVPDLMVSSYPAEGTKR